MKRIITFTFCAILAAVCFSGCIVVNFSDFNAVSGKGNLEKYELRVSEYSGIKAEGFFEIKYHAASSNIIILEVQSNLREYIKTEVINGDLVVSTTKRISANSGKTPVLTVSTPVLKRLSIEGICTFTAYDKIRTDSLILKLSGAGRGKAELDVNDLFVDLSGVGDFELSGRADNAEMNLSGAGNMEALSLQTQTAKINLSGSGNIKVNCTKNLRINASGIGSVEYKGSPAVDISKDGMVSIRKLD